MFLAISRRALLRASLLVVSVSLLGLNACKKDDDKTETGPTAQDITLELEHLGSDGQPLVYGKTYTTALGASYVIDSLKYYVSNVKFTRNDGLVWVAPKAYYLVRATSAPADNVVLTVPAVPVGTYSKVTFSVGVDSINNRSGDKPGVLNPKYNMLWPWNTGYKFLTIDGKVGAANIRYHIGSNAIYRKHTLTLSLPQNATVTSKIAPELHVQMEVNKVFGGVGLNNMDLTTTPSVMGGANALLVAENIAKAFSVEHVHNDPK
jgi:hypothetical protein